ncbi:MAG: hypothetical protein L3J41_03220 [Melioribacteraceae bacterium]|nr:hypothetical protein [Melioribacteraceae bacterium]
MKPILFYFLFLITSFVVAQDDENIYTDYLDENVLDFIYKSRPMIEIDYGIGSPSNKNISGEFADVGSWDIKLGKSEQKNFKGILVDLSERYIFASYLSSNAQNLSSTDNKILTDTYRFGFGSRDGIGYGGSFISVTPYISQDFVWTQLSSYSNTRLFQQSKSDRIVDNDALILDDYLGTFRFGDRATYGMKIEIASTFQINPYYETSVVYRRHLFWYWSGSFIVSQAGYNILSHFTDEIVDSSPILGPIFNFALKAGYLYGYYLLRQENMNWPFNPSGNEAPLTFETFNIGASFVF